MKTVDFEVGEARYSLCERDFPAAHIELMVRTCEPHKGGVWTTVARLPVGWVESLVKAATVPR